jgi:hypothetical protein
MTNVMAERVFESRSMSNGRARKLAELTGTEYPKDLRADANFYTADPELLVPGRTS